MNTMHISLIKWTVGILAALLLATVLAPFAIVPAGTRGVMTTMGKPSEDVYSEGIHFRMPIFQQMHLMDVRISKSEGEGDAASKDLQQVRVKVAVNYHLDPAAVAKTFRDVGQTTDDVVARILDPARPEAFKAVTALFTAEELITKRTQVREQIAALLREKMTRQWLIKIEFAIVHFAFSQSLRTIEKWDGHLPQVTGGAMPLMDFTKFARK
jgi:regulator of protease activity HflC (stomatin/prohibitin superfamily)